VLVVVVVVMVVLVVLVVVVVVVLVVMALLVVVVLLAGLNLWAGWGLTQLGGVLLLGLSTLVVMDQPPGVPLAAAAGVVLATTAAAVLTISPVVVDRPLRGLALQQPQRSQGLEP